MLAWNRIWLLRLRYKKLRNMITKEITFQGFYTVITSVNSFKLDTSVVTLDYLEVKPGKRHYLVAYGVHGSVTTPPRMKEATRAVTVVDSSGAESVTIMFSVILFLLLLQYYLHV